MFALTLLFVSDNAHAYCEWKTTRVDPTYNGGMYVGEKFVTSTGAIVTTAIASFWNPNYLAYLESQIDGAVVNCPNTIDQYLNDNINVRYEATFRNLSTKKCKLVSRNDGGFSGKHFMLQFPWGQETLTQAYVCTK